MVKNMDREMRVLEERNRKGEKVKKNWNSWGEDETQYIRNVAIGTNGWRSIVQMEIKKEN